MRAVLSDLENNSFNPLDLIEDVVVSNDWPHTELIMIHCTLK